jgi:hypothetical protein
VTEIEYDWRMPQGADYAPDEPEFMAEFGRALAEWGNIEHRLSSVFAIVICSAEVMSARSAFHAIVGFRDRIQVIERPLKIKFGTSEGPQWRELEGEWSRISDIVQKASRKRNKLAHMHVWQGPKLGTFGAQDISRLSDLPTDPKERSKLVVTIETLRSYRESFVSVAMRIETFRASLLEAYGKS